MQNLCSLARYYILLLGFGACHCLRVGLHTSAILCRWATIWFWLNPKSSKYIRTEISHTEINPRCRNPRHGFHDQSALGLNGWFLHMICCYCHLRWSSLLVVSCGWASPLYMDLYHFIFFGVKDALTWRLFFLHQFLLKSMVGIRLQARSPQGVWQHSRRSECMDMPCDLRGEMKKTAPILTTHNRIMENRRAV